MVIIFNGPGHRGGLPDKLFSGIGVTNVRKRNKTG